MAAVPNTAAVPLVVPPASAPTTVFGNGSHAEPQHASRSTSQLTLDRPEHLDQTAGALRIIALNDDEADIRRFIEEGEDPPRKIKVVEAFKGPRIKQHTGVLRRIRSVVLLIVIGALLAAVLAGVLVLIVWGISAGIHHASTH